MTDDRTGKVRENRVRRMATRQGLTLQRSRRRDPRAIGYGRYWLVNREGGWVLGGNDGASLDDIESALLDTGRAAR